MQRREEEIATGLQKGKGNFADGKQKSNDIWHTIIITKRPTVWKKD